MIIRKIFYRAGASDEFPLGVLLEHNDVNGVNVQTIIVEEFNTEGDFDPSQYDYHETPDEAAAVKFSATPEPANEERDLLIEQLDQAGVDYDKRWGVDKLRAALSGAEAA